MEVRMGRHYISYSIAAAARVLGGGTVLPVGRAYPDLICVFRIF